MDPFVIEPGSRQPRRAFQVTVGLREGWDPGARVHGLEEASMIALDWARQRAAAGRPYLSGMFTRGQVVYARAEGEVGAGYEPVAIFSGEVLDQGIADAMVETLLDELASRLGQALHQERLYLAYRGQTWVLCRKKAL